MLRILRDTRKRMLSMLVIVALLVPALPMVAMAEGHEWDAELSIAENLVEDGRFDTLVAAAGIAGLAGALDDCEEFGPVTLFAPTDTAFAALEAALGAEAWAALLADPDSLRDVLLYHLLDGEVYAADVLALVAEGPETVPTLLDGESIEIELTGGSVVINGVALVIQTDLQACNGVVHVINAVLVPEEEDECKTIAEIAAEAGIFNTLLAAAGIAGLDGALADPDFGPVTLFAPTDTAFAALEAALGAEAWAALLADPDALRDVLRYHLLDGEVYASDLPAPGNSIVVPTLLGQDLLIEVTTEGVLINGVALVIETDIEACNGVIHVIDAVLVPPVDEEIPPVTAPEEEEAVEALVPGLPATGLGPDRAALPWQAVVLASLVLGLAYSTRRRNAVSPE